MLMCSTGWLNEVNGEILRSIRSFSISCPHTGGGGNCNISVTALSVGDDANMFHRMAKKGKW